MASTTSFDVIIVGGGHAGCEAASASWKMGVKTALVTLDPTRIGVLSCNPAVGGLAKGQLVKEVDALGGVMGRITDQTAIQYRRLNESKGPAVRSSRAQCDKPLYARRMQEYLASLEGLSIISGEAQSFKIESGKITGLTLMDGTLLTAKAVVITSGTFLSAVMHMGEEKVEGGRLGDASAKGMSPYLLNLGFKLRRLKTGTPPRLHKRSIAWDQLEAQPGDLIPRRISFYYKGQKFPELPQVNCFITYTNAQVHEIIEKNLSRSPMYTGAITGVGPRYCPSIEDKVKKFSERDSHQLFLEPEGLHVDEIYVNGISTSLPKEVQTEFISKIKGLENAEFIRHGYAVEYDAVDARQLKATLESKEVEGLFFAGQVNGTSGYEEAAGQGIVAGIHAALKVKNLPERPLGRHEAYIGVMVDDLVLKGSDEPYRMFTSRAEYRLLLREDNADLRLSELGRELGLLSDADYRTFCEKKEQIERWKGKLESFHVYPHEETQVWLKTRGLPPIKDRINGDVFLRRPEVSWSDLSELGFDSHQADFDVGEQIEIQVKYQGYIDRDVQLMQGVQKSEALKIPVSLEYGLIPGLSNEIKNKLSETRPETIGQASRVQGVTPAAVANLMIYLRMSPHR